MTIHTPAVVRIGETLSVSVTRDEYVEGLDMTNGLLELVKSLGMIPMPEGGENFIAACMQRVRDPECHGFYFGTVGPNGPVNIVEIVVK